MRLPLSRSWLPLVAAAALGGCYRSPDTFPVRSYTFSAGALRQDALDVLVRAMLAEGLQPEKVDPELRLVHTQWVPTRGKSCEKRARYPYQRYTALLMPAADGQQAVTLRIDQYCCAVAFWQDTAKKDPGSDKSCESFGEVTEADQRTLDAVGASLQPHLLRAASATP